jgi:hypothetical protein
MTMAGFDKKIEGWFSGRRWRVLTEVDGAKLVSGVTVIYRQGAFEIPIPGVFVTPIGHRGRHGFLVIETDGNGNDIAGSEQAFGEAVLRRASENYGLISGLPEKAA